MRSSPSRSIVRFQLAVGGDGFHSVLDTKHRGLRPPGEFGGLANFGRRERDIENVVVDQDRRDFIRPAAAASTMLEQAVVDEHVATNFLHSCCGRLAGELVEPASGSCGVSEASPAQLA